MPTWNAENPLKILIAPDSYKTTASATTAAAYLHNGALQGLADAGMSNDAVEIVRQPLADGGEGTSILFGAQAYTVPTTTATGGLSEATYFYDAANQTAYIDIAAASGIAQVKDALKPLTADTYGTGVLIAAAIAEGATDIVLGLGGSATIDGGTGILVALGAQLRNAAGIPLAPGGGALEQLDTIDLTELNTAVAKVRFHLLSDVTNPATGPNGAAYIYGPQKGADAQACAQLDAGLSKLCDITGVDPSTPAFGAAGGAAISISWLCSIFDPTGANFEITPGAATLLSHLAPEISPADADLIMTGEGACDATSFTGKVVGTLYEHKGAQTYLGIAAGKLATDLKLPERTIGVELPTAGIQEQLETAGAQLIAKFLAAYET
ncbi:MAG: glycerate kinase [Corynebacterium sp.]|nr:glycerate kinase [Corynebacterium sp.]